MLGTILSTPTNYVIRFDLLLEHEIDKVWAALTEPQQLVKWLADADIELTIGAQLQLRFSNTGSVINGQVTQVEPPHLLEFTWTSPGEAASLVRWELAQEQEGTRLILKHTLNTCSHLAEMLAGWHTHLEGLPSAILGNHVDWPWERWHETHDLYKQQALLPTP